MHTPNDPSTDTTASSVAHESDPPLELDWEIELESAFDELEAGALAESSAAT
jgi:hypothetical protein